MSKRNAKPAAELRTVDMFTGVTKLEEIHAATEEVKEAPRLSETIEQAAERWRANAFFTAEHLSKHFNGSLPGASKFRLTEKDGWLFLEKFSLDSKGEAYSWAGLMFTEADLYELTSVFVKAARVKKSAEDSAAQEAELKAAKAKKAMEESNG